MYLITRHKNTDKLSAKSCVKRKIYKEIGNELSEIKVEHEVGYEERDWEASIEIDINQHRRVE